MIPLEYFEKKDGARFTSSGQQTPQYPDEKPAGIKWWTRNDWKASGNGKKKTTKVRSNQGGGSSDDEEEEEEEEEEGEGEATGRATRHLETRTGKAISSSRAKQITAFVSDWYTYKANQDPNNVAHTWKKAGLKFHEEFFLAARTKFEEFRYCKGDWKALVTATESYYVWMRKFKKSLTGFIVKSEANATEPPKQDRKWPAAGFSVSNEKRIKISQVSTTRLYKTSTYIVSYNYAQNTSSGSKSDDHTLSSDDMEIEDSSNTSLEIPEAASKTTIKGKERAIVLVNPL